MTEVFSASRANRLMHCPASGNLDIAIPGFSFEPRPKMAGAAGAGTRIHELIAAALRSADTTTQLDWLNESLMNIADLHFSKRDAIFKDPTAFTSHLAQTDRVYVEAMLRLFDMSRYDYADTNGNIVHTPRLTPSQLRFIAGAVSFVLTQAPSDIYEGGLNVERKLRATWLQSKPVTTCDLSWEHGDTLCIVDWKTGKIPVDAKDNDQLLFYAATTLSNFKYNPKYIQMSIVQPGHDSFWTITCDELYKWMIRAIDAEQKLLNKEIVFQAGKHCMFCPANPMSRGDKGSPLCPVQLNMLSAIDTDVNSILDLKEV